MIDYISSRYGTGSGASKLASLSDVDFSNLKNDSVLVFNAVTSKWEIASYAVGEAASGPLYSGVDVQPTLTNNNGTVTIGTGSYSLYETTDYTGPPILYENVGGGTFTLTDDTVNYIICQLVDGVPTVSATTNLDIVNNSDVIKLYIVYRSGNFVHQIPTGDSANGLAEKLLLRLRRTKRFEIEDGFGISEIPTRIINVENGTVWYGSQHYGVNSAIQGDAGTTTIFIHHVNGDWVTDATTTQYNNTQYDDGTNLVALSPKRYAVNWIFRGIETPNHIYYVLGEGDYTLAEAEQSTQPDVSSMISSHAVLVGRIIVENGASVATRIEQVSRENFGSIAVASHDDLIDRNIADQHPIAAITDLQTTLDGKQETLVSGTNIKTINNNSLLGAGDLTIEGATYTAGNGLTLTDNVFSLTGVTAGDLTIGAIGYNGTTKVAGQFDGGTTDPTNTNRLNYDGDFYATNFYGDGSNLSGITGGATLTDDTVTDITQYLGMSRDTSGAWTEAYTASTELYFNPSTGTLNSTAFNTLSDRNYKTNILKIDDASSTLDKLEGVEFNWTGNNNKSAGVIAQELEQILPHLVSTNDVGIKSVNYDGIIGYLIEGNKELNKRVTELENIVELLIQKLQ